MFLTSLKYLFLRLRSELVQLKLNIGASDGDSTPSEEKRGTPTYRSGGLKKLDKYVSQSPMLDRIVTDDCARGRKSDLGTYVDIYIE